MERRMLVFGPIIFLFGILIFLTTITIGIIKANAGMHTIIVKCYDRNYNEIIGMQCKETVSDVNFPNFMLATFSSIAFILIIVGIIICKEE